ncbi:hypothetical protein ASPWEDRAFT_171355 [Aspergillus wentii DTO 134E9]|uniref:Uncharacterized protein n=1 Tax=Aspergillus wentii DTO 134E9 TaxID=1073089 RepID=A0A1L9RSH4_ASPWE|nr:uncharacterized protein ASPWEDRAFT_171355 [Aspergillus wentii DTO 134E9]KAI9930731.1 hypothetical protein MW887_011488 [Aspergillus wentii]OJJ37901.1 hypothetical protein ASPWEDRAFT_171355 [Aspergillus wentii DTO 134E9]
MDKLSGIASKLGGNKSHGSSSNTSGQGQEDYVDKGLDSIESKHGMDPSKMRSANEKITDTGREMFEKKTGKHVPEKISN